MKISIRELEELTRKAVTSYGYRDEEVRIISDVCCLPNCGTTTRAWSS